MLLGVLLGEGCMYLVCIEKGTRLPSALLQKECGHNLKSNGVPRY